MAEKDPTGIENVEVEPLSDDDLESVSGGNVDAGDSDVADACCTDSDVADACCDSSISS